MSNLGIVTASGGATAVCAEGTRVIEKELKAGDVVSLNQVIRTLEGGVLAIALPDGGQLEISGGREITLTERVVSRLAPSKAAARSAEAETDPEIAAMLEALLAGEDPSEMEATAAGGAQSEGGSSFVIIQRNGQRTLVDLEGLESEAALRKLFGELGEDVIIALLEEAGIPVVSISLTEDDHRGTTLREGMSGVSFDGRGVFGTLSFDPQSGTWTYELSEAGKAALNLLGVSESGRPESVTEVFEFTLVDADGNVVAAIVTVTVNGVDDPLLISNLTPQGIADDLVVDETDLPGASDSGSFDITVPDGFGALNIAGTGISFNQLLASADQPINITTSLGNTLTIFGYSGDYTGGTINYRYTLNAAENHPAGDGDLTESLAVLLTDDDGDSIAASIDVRIVDDTPVTQGTDIVFGEDTGTGSAGTEGNHIGADVPGSISCDGIGEYGTLSLENGQWVYTLNVAGQVAASLLGGLDETGAPQTLGESFEYSYIDEDGDVRTASVNVTVLGVDDPVDVTGSVVIVDEGDLASGSHPEGGAGDSHPQYGVSATGEVQITAPDGIAAITIGLTTLTFTQLAGATPESTVAVDGGVYGYLEIIDYAGDLTGGTVTYRYTLTGNVQEPGDSENEQTGDRYAISVTDGDGTVNNTATIGVQVIDDMPVLGGIVQNGLMSGEPGTLNGLIEVRAGADGLDGPISITGISGIPDNVTYSTEQFDGYSVLTATSTGDDGAVTLFTLTVNKDGTYSFTLNEAQVNTQQEISIAELSSGSEGSPYTVTTTKGTLADGGDLLANPITFSSATGSSINISGQGIGAGNNHINVDDTLTMTWANSVSAATLTFSRIDDYKTQGQVVGRETVAFSVLLGGVIVATGQWVPPAIGNNVPFVYDPATAATDPNIQNYQVIGDWDGAAFDAIAVSVVNDPNQPDPTEALDLVNITTSEVLVAENLDLSFFIEFQQADGDSLGTTLDIDVIAAGDPATGFELVGTDSSEVILGSSGPDQIDAGGGDDTIYFDAQDTINGGEGMDTLIIDGTFPRGAMVSNIEVLDTRDGAGDDRINLSETDVLSITDQNNFLRILGDAGDEVRLDVADTWIRGETVDNFTTYFSNDATIEVQAGIDVRYSDESGIS